MKEAVADSDAVFVGAPRRRQENPDGSAWVSFDVQRVFAYRSDGLTKVLEAGGGPSDAQMPFTGYFMFEPVMAPQKLQVGTSYVIFAYGDPAQIVCPERSLAVVSVDGETLQLTGGAPPMYAARTVDELAAEIVAAS